MVFSSVAFIFFFLPLCLAGNALAGRRFRNSWLLAMSALFYIWGSGTLVLLLVFSTLIDYSMGRLVARGTAAGDPRLVRLGVTSSVVANVGLLGYFKYSNFFVAEVNRLGVADIEWTSVSLPVGISFFTFQSMSYTIDIARGRAEVLKNPIDFALYVLMFPQLIAGPIVRFHEIAQQLLERSTSAERFAGGAVRFSHGLAKKVLVADAIAPLADAAFAGSDLSAPVAWLGIIAYALQIYFDFSGYSDMAIGLGLMLGFDFPENFNRPYSALSVTDFWRRWHITLSNWFRDYVYFPLGGSRGGPLRTLLNLWIVFALTGIWHGASWNFVVWGLFHGALLVGERLLNQRAATPAGFANDIVRRIYVLLAVLVGWVFFRASDLGAALDYLGQMFTPGGGTPAEVSTALSNRAMLALAVGCSTVFIPRTFVTGKYIAGEKQLLADPVRVAWTVGVLPLALIVVASDAFSPFLYFQF